MLHTRLPKWISRNKNLTDLVNAIFLGLLSSLFGHTHIPIPGYEDVFSDLREIPLVVSVLYIKNPLFLMFTILISPVFEFNAPYLPTVIMHILPVMYMWVFYKSLNSSGINIRVRGYIWVIGVIIYYLVILLPGLILSYWLFGMYNEEPFIDFYNTLVLSTRFEVISTVLVTSLYLVQFEIRQKLEFTTQHLEELVQERTTKLSEANKELSSLNTELKNSNQEIQKLNENLESIVEERTQKINDQLSQLNKYAHMNSHKVRGPVSRILGLTELIKMEPDQQARVKLFELLIESTKELDNTIKKMNSLLVQEIDKNRS